MKIEQAENGFIYTDDLGRLFIYKTLTELANNVEGSVNQSPRGTHYAAGYSVKHLDTVRCLLNLGKKIDAIMLLRDIYEPRMGLKEAKELVDAMCNV